MNPFIVHNHTAVFFFYVFFLVPFIYAQVFLNQSFQSIIPLYELIDHPEE